MKPLSSLISLCAVVAAVAAQDPGPSPPRPASEALTAWQWYQEVALPAWKEPPRWLDFLVPPSVFDQARPDLGDLRLIDGQNREVPYALRVRQARDERVPLDAREYNRARAADRSAKLSLDLGAMPREHNEIRVHTLGGNFRRRLQVQGSNDAKTWQQLKLDREFLVHFQVDGGLVEVNKAAYTPSRFQFLRVRVLPDLSLAEDRPEIASVQVWRTIRVPGENVTLPATLGERQPERTEGSPGSAWMIDLGARVPCKQLTFDIAESEFQRRYVLEIPGSEDEEAILWGKKPVAGGTWERRPGDKPRPLVIDIPHEIAVRRLRLLVTDHRNPPLTIQGVRYTAPARQVVFAPVPDLAPPLRLYFGQPTATRAHYDFEALLPPDLTPPPVRASLGPIRANPNYQPPPKPLTERWPWLVYVVLTAASLVLLSLLVGLGREVIARHDAAAPAGDSQASAAAPPA